MEAPFLPTPTLMRKVAFTLVLALITSVVAGRSNAAARWPQFRGPNGSGVAQEGSPPIHFGPGSNVLWKIDLPSGTSSPCIWGDHLFLTAFDPESKKLELICVAGNTGAILWRQVAPANEIEETHVVSNPATASPAPMSNEMRSTASVSRSPWRKATERSRTERRGVVTLIHRSIVRSLVGSLQCAALYWTP